MLPCKRLAGLSVCFFCTCIVWLNTICVFVGRYVWPLEYRCTADVIEVFFFCFVQRSAQFWKCLQVYCGSSRLKPQLKLSSVRVRKKHLATARDALTPKLEQNLQQPYAPWRNLWSILEHTLIRLRVGLDPSCVALHSGDAFGGEVDPVFLRNLAIANERSDSMPSIDPVLHVCVTSKWLMQARHWTILVDLLSHVLGLDKR